MREDFAEYTKCIGCSASLLLCYCNCPKCGKGKLAKATASEVGNVFDLGQKYGENFDLGFLGRDGKKQFPVMGCYGLGISRVMGVIVETFNDELGIVWPEEVAPFRIHLIGLDLEDRDIMSEATRIYKLLQAEGIEVLFDDRIEASAGQKFADADLIGIPVRVVISKKTTEGKLEVKKRSEKKTNFYSLQDLLKIVQ